MKKQVFNPYLPSYEYVPDGEPHVFNDRLYIFGSHDRFDGPDFCVNDYVCYSTPVDDLADWKFEGTIYHRHQDPNGGGRVVGHGMAAPDVCQGADGRYYLYYFIGGSNKISVAVCDTPAGAYEFLGFVRYADGTFLGDKKEPYQFDPGVFVDEDEKIYLYTGFALTNNPFLTGKLKPTLQGPMGYELETDMLTIKRGAFYLGVGPRNSKGTKYEGHEFLEASSMRKFEGKYYFIYSSQLSHELCYAVSDYPDKEFSYGGTLISNGDIGLTATNTKNALNYTGNTHGSIIKIGDKYYIFYHRQTNRHCFSRQGCAEEIRFVDGRFEQAEMTSCGLNQKPLEGKGDYEARIACNLASRDGTRWYIAVKGLKGKHPYFTQSGADRDENPDQYIANMCEGAMAGFKYFDLQGTERVGVTMRGKGKGEMLVYTERDQKEVARIAVELSADTQTFYAPLSVDSEKSALYLIYHGSGHLDFLTLHLR